jgi:hypothetical protein
VRPVRGADNLTVIYEPIVQTSDGQLAVCRPNPARGLIYSGPRQVLGLFVKILTSQRNGIEFSIEYNVPLAYSILQTFLPSCIVGRYSSGSSLESREYGRRDSSR